MQDWRELTITELRDRYDQERYAPNQQTVLGDMARQSRAARETLVVEPFRYGAEAVETGWWCPAASPGGDVVCFLHGGAWRAGRGENYLFPAPWITAAGLHYASLEFGSALDFGGSIHPMVRQAQRGLAHVIRAAASRGAATRVHLIGHSSGAHLAACLATLDWSVLVPEHPEALRSVMLCSGSYDLEPVSHSGRRDYLRLDPTEIHALSPLQHVFDPQRPVLLAAGERESPEFLRHHATLAAKLRRAGVPLQAAVLPDLNHFEIMRTFGSADGALARFWQDGLAELGGGAAV